MDVGNPYTSDFTVTASSASLTQYRSYSLLANNTAGSYFGLSAEL
jgi:hypothetical protein